MSLPGDSVAGSSRRRLAHEAGYRRSPRALILRLRPRWLWLLLLPTILIVLGCQFAAAADSQQLYLEALLDFERYAETIWHPATYAGAPPDAGYWGDGGSSGNGGIRGNSGIAVACAALVLARPGDPLNATRLDHVRQALNYDTATHVTGAYNCVNGHQWGWSSSSSGDWQTPMWAASMGFACVLVQSNLPAQTVLDCQRVVASEATHRAGIPPASGYVGDTKAEENAWQGNILALAAAWMGTNSSASVWLDAAKSYLVNTYTVADTNGDPLASWISTITLYPSYSLENHGFYHPTYEMVAGMSSGDSLLMARMANTNIAAELQPYAEHNVMTVWRTNLEYMVMDSGEFAYPAGLDWELHDYEQDSYITWMATHFNDPVARWADGQLAQLVRYRQIVNGNGEFVGPSGGGFYREAVEARRTAIAWLHLAYADHPSGPTNAPEPAVVHFPDAKIIAQRSPYSFVSISYGSRIMGVIEAAAASVPTNAFVATPALPGVIGNGPLGNPTAASLISFSTNSTGFDAELMLQNGANGSTHVYVKSTGQSIGIVEVPLPAAGVTGTSAGCFTNGIENDPLTGGTRMVQWEGGSSNVVNRSNVRFNINSSWVCIADHYGVSAGPAGFFHYRAANGYNRSGAAQDYLCFKPTNRLAPRYAVWFPGRNAATTALLASQISWTSNGNTVVLSFPGPAGATQVISAVLTSGDGAWTSDSDGNWSDASKWSGGNVADGAGSVADFSELNITSDRTVTLDSSRTIGILGFGDTSGGQNWTLDSIHGSILTLSAGTPYIVVLQNTATINAPLAGMGGFTKAGPGTLVLSGANSLSGVLYVDTASSSSSAGSDGAVRVTTGAALANITSLSIRNNTGSENGSTLQLDGSTGGITVNQDLTASCRNNLTPNLENMAGSNTLAGNLFMQTGGTNVVVQSDNGTLVLAGALQYVGNLTAGRSFNFFGDGDAIVTGPIHDAANGALISVGMFGRGTLALRGINSFDGALNLKDGVVDFADIDNLGAASAMLDFDGGTLRFAPGNDADISTHFVHFSVGGAQIDTAANEVTLANGIGGDGPGRLTKLGTGTLSLDGATTYTGGTAVSNGVLRVNGSLANGPVFVAGGSLRGRGTIAGPVTVLGGGTLSPGDSSIGSLTINNTLINSGALLMRLQKSGSTLTNDTIKGLDGIDYGGALQLETQGDPLAAGDSFRLFQAATYTGSFAEISPATPGAGLAWNTSDLALNGTLTVVAAAVPRFDQVRLEGANLLLDCAGGPAGGTCQLMSSTNLSLGLRNWSVIGSGRFNSSGEFSFTNTIDPALPQRYYRLQVP